MAPTRPGRRPHPHRAARPGGPDAARPRGCRPAGVRGGAGRQGLPGGVEPRRQPAGGVRVPLDRQLRQPRPARGRPRPRSTPRRTAGSSPRARLAPTASIAPGPTASSRPGCRSRPSSTRRTAIDDETFYRIWHGEHTPLSFEIHPFWMYVRNQVLRSITARRATRAGHRLRGGADGRADARLHPVLRLSPTSPTGSRRRSSGSTTT